MSEGALGFLSKRRRNPEANDGLQEFLARSCYCESHHSENGELTQLVDSKCSKSDMDLALDELLSDFHSYQPPLLNEGSSLLSSLSPPPLPKSPFKDEHEIILPPPPDFQDDDPSGSSLLLQALTPPPNNNKSAAHLIKPPLKSTTDLLINEINELSELLPPNFIENKVVLAPSNPSSPSSSHSRFLSTPRKPGPHSRICIISKREETPETDSGIESIESLSPKEFDFSPACSPAGPKGLSTNGSNSAPPYFPNPTLGDSNSQQINSGAILSSLLNNSPTATSEPQQQLLFHNEQQQGEQVGLHSFLQPSDELFDSLETEESTLGWARESGSEESSSYRGGIIFPTLSSDSWEPNYSQQQRSPESTSSKKIPPSLARRMNNCKDFFCDKCKMSLGSKTKYDRHMRSHGRNKEFKCESCGKEFMVKKNLTLHYKLHTEQKEEHTCSLCFKSYQSKSGLGAHVKLMHSQEEELFVCPKGIYEEGGSSGHPPREGKRAADGRRSLNPCDNCNKSFKTKKTLLKHIEKAYCIPPDSSSWIPNPSPSELLQTIHSMELDELLF